jgi:DNA end-binding protein Ku
MPRSLWRGSLSFGLVNVPVQLYPATEEKQIHFHQFKAGTNERIHNKRVAGNSSKEVDFDDIVKGYELKSGRYVMVTPEELESVEPGRSRTIEIEDFVDLADVDPIHFQKSYYLAPKPDVGADKPYALLRKAMARSGKIAIARFVLRTKQYLAAIRVKDDVLVLETMLFPDEIRPAKDIGDLPSDRQVNDKELKIADQLIDSLSVKWDPTRYKDTYRERVLDLIQRKGKGEDIVVDAEAPEEAEVVDLMAALEASLKEHRQPSRGPAKRSTKTASKSSSKATKKTTKRTSSSKRTAKKAS